MNRQAFEVTSTNIELITRKAFQIFQSQIAENEFSEQQLSFLLEALKYHLIYTFESLNFDSELILSDYIAWTESMFEKFNISYDFLIKSFSAIIFAIRQIYGDDEADVAKRILDLAFLNSRILKTTETIFRLKFEEDINRYINCVLSYDRIGTQRIIEELFEKGYDLKTIYFDFFGTLLEKVGLMWQKGDLSISEEHLITGWTEFLITELSTKAQKSKKNGKTVVATCAPKELHEVGLKMICNLLEIDGYEVFFLGSNIPYNDIVNFVLNKSPEALLISSSMFFSVGEVKNIIEKVRSFETEKDIKIIVGGRTFDMDKNLWKKLGADFYANNYNKLKDYLDSI